MTNSSDELLTLPEAAQLLRVKISTLRSWRHQRRLPFVKLGGKVLLRKSDAASFVFASVVPADVPTAADQLTSARVEPRRNS